MAIIAKINFKKFFYKNILNFHFPPPPHYRWLFELSFTYAVIHWVDKFHSYAYNSPYSFQHAIQWYFAMLRAETHNTTYPLRAKFVVYTGTCIKLIQNKLTIRSLFADYMFKMLSIHFQFDDLALIQVIIHSLQQPLFHSVYIFWWSFYSYLIVHEFDVTL